MIHAMRQQRPTRRHLAPVAYDASHIAFMGAASSIVQRLTIIVDCDVARLALRP